MSTHPIKYKNSTGASMPAYGIFRLSTAARDGTTNKLVPTAQLVEFDGTMPLFVNSERAIANNAYGDCRSIHDSPFWVRYDGSNAPANGDIVGPVDGETFVSEKGDGFIVLFKDATPGLVWCAALNSHRMYFAELTATLSAASNMKTGSTTAAAKLLVQDPSNANQLIDGPTVTVRNRWVDLSLASGKRLLVARVGTEWTIVSSECP